MNYFYDCFFAAIIAVLKKVIILSLMFWSISVLGQNPQNLNQTLTTTGNWSTASGSSYIIENGHLKCTMKLQANSKYRGDIWYNESGIQANNITLNPTKDIYLAVKFIGDRPSGVIKFEMKKDDNGTLTWLNTKWNGNVGDGNITTTGNNKIYYFQLTKDGGYSGSADIAIRQLHITLADATVAPFEYQVDWVATFASVADIEAYKDFKDDGESDTDDSSIDPSTLGGYINSDFFSGAESWAGATSENVYRNNDRLIVTHNGSARLQAKKNGVSMNATNFPYLAVKMDKLPEGFDQSNLKIQTNCSGIGVYDSWYSVVHKKGDVYIFDMTQCVNKNSLVPQNAITTTNPADVWIDFGRVTSGTTAQIDWIKTYQILAEIPTETADELLAETNVDAGKVNYTFDVDELSSNSWDWTTVHWQGGENGCKVSAANGQLVLTPVDQVGGKTTNLIDLNTANYPLLALKIDDMGDADLFKLQVSSISKGNYIKRNDAGSSFVTVKGDQNNIYVFDLSTQPMYSTATDVSLRADFYKGAENVSATQPVKIDWIKSFKTMAEIDALVTSINSVEVLSNIFVSTTPDAIKVHGADEGMKVNVYNMLGAKIASEIVSADITNLFVPKTGVFVVEISGNGISKTCKVLK